MKQSLPLKPKIVWSGQTEYFLTSSTFLHYPYFREDKQKQIILNKINQLKEILGVDIQAFSIAMNHFHLKFYLEKGQTMKQLKNMLHSGISREYRKQYDVKFKDFWGTSKTYFIKNEEMSWKVTGYIIGNLLKHKEVSTFKELKENPFSSYSLIVKELGEEIAQELVQSVIEINEDAKGIVDMDNLSKIKSVTMGNFRS